MKYNILLFSAIVFLFIVNILADYWYKIYLPNAYIYPCVQPPCGNIGTNVYSTEFPTAPKQWYFEQDCNEYRMTSTRWVSDYLNEVSGISFKGLIYKQVLGKRENEFAIFFHERRCYGGGAEYGFVFPENSLQGFFYLCGNCNLENQNWCQWPGDCKATGNCINVQKALENPTNYQYWNIKVLEEGNFLIEIVDPVTWQYRSCKILKPDWFPNLYKASGYVTVNAQKGTDPTIQPPPYMHVDEVKIWK